MRKVIATTSVALTAALVLAGCAADMESTNVEKKLITIGIN